MIVPGRGIGIQRLPAHDDKARGVVLAVGDVGAQRHQAIDLTRQFRGDRGLRDVAGLGHVGGGAGGVGMDDRLQAQLVDDLAGTAAGHAHGCARS